MSARLSPSPTATPPSLEDLEVRFHDAGLDPRVFSNNPGDRYDWHEHPRHKILLCAVGAITFHTREGDILLEAGDRIDIEPETAHAAHVHGEGVACIEAYADGPDDLPASGAVPGPGPTG
jgi:quercetin dioxygenase-like cupin family protein